MKKKKLGVWGLRIFAGWGLGFGMGFGDFPLIGVWDFGMGFGVWDGVSSTGSGFGMRKDQIICIICSVNLDFCKAKSCWLADNILYGVWGLGYGVWGLDCWGFKKKYREGPYV